MQTIGSRLASLREMGGVSRAELAAFTGMSRGYPGHIETGRYADIGVSILGRIAEVFGASLDWFATGEGDPPALDVVKEGVKAARARLAEEQAAAEVAAEAAAAAAAVDPDSDDGAA